MPRYVILEHDHPQRHWDLMLESGPALRTWRLAAAPVVGAAVRAEASFDHRRAYLDYEGPVGDNRGTVVRWDHGTYALESEEPDRLRLRLTGQRLCGNAALTRCGESWAFLLDVEN